MVSLTCDCTERDGVTLVTARLDGGSTPQRVRLANRLDGPVWPPRRRGVPEAGWSDSGVETVVPPGTTVAVGYASPAPAADPPVELVDRELVDEGCSRGRWSDARGQTGDGTVTPSAALRDLGDPSPPRDAVPIPIDDDATEAATNPPSDPEPTAATPDAVAAWLDAVEERVATAERLTTADTVPEATDALRAVGSLAEAEALVESLGDDAEALESVARRVERLSERAVATDVPLDTLDRFV